MPKSHGIIISLQGWDPKVFEPKQQYGKTLKSQHEIWSHTITTETEVEFLKEDNFRDKKNSEYETFKGTDFKGTLEYHMLKVGRGLFENKKENNPVVYSDDSILIDRPVREVGAQPDSFHSTKKFRQARSEDRMIHHPHLQDPTPSPVQKPSNRTQKQR